MKISSQLLTCELNRNRICLEWQCHNIRLNFRLSFRTVASITAMTFVAFKALKLSLLYVQRITPLVDCTVVRETKKSIAFGQYVINT